VEAGLPAKYKGQSKQFFEAVVEFARNCCTDKVLSVYFMGLSIFQSALAPPICGPDVSPQSVNNAIK
jgi:centrosomal protein CEP104